VSLSPNGLRIQHLDQPKTCLNVLHRLGGQLCSIVVRRGQAESWGAAPPLADHLPEKGQTWVEPGSGGSTPLVDAGQPLELVLVDLLEKGRALDRIEPLDEDQRLGRKSARQVMPGSHERLVVLIG
jgi:hypothetical protein